MRYSKLYVFLFCITMHDLDISSPRNKVEFGSYLVCFILCGWLRFLRIRD
uniref:Uncharacterized protein n=1 Tax=Anguilla anguilla TaxID=7936 RepID=A0A0E9UBR0_ANGAN